MPLIFFWQCFYFLSLCCYFSKQTRRFLSSTIFPNQKGLGTLAFLHQNNSHQCSHSFAKVQLNLRIHLKRQRTYPLPLENHSLLFSLVRNLRLQGKVGALIALLRNLSSKRHLRKCPPFTWNAQSKEKNTRLN